MVERSLSMREVRGSMPLSSIFFFYNRFISICVIRTMDAPISLTTLGGGQSIGKSCFLLSVGDQHVLLDCGSFVGKDTKKALPDFTKLPKSVTINNITAVLISHFHMDHVGGLLYLTEQLKYKGDIYASNPTRAVLPLLLRNNR